MKRIGSIKKRWSLDQLITGIELPKWAQVLKDNELKVDGSYAHRAAWITALSVPTTALGAVEDARFGRQLASMEIDPTPIFVLGHWRSGTTHMHNLLGRAPQMTYPTVYQVVMPGNFLTTGGVLPDITAKLMDDTRTYDNVKHGWNEAAEDEIALAKLTGLSPYLSFMFPDHAARYEKYIDFIEADTAERKEWMDALRYLIKKIMVATDGKRVIVKSCTHTARIRLILEMFPDARFVFIHRNPYEVFLSTIHMRSHTDWENFFQLPYENWDDERIRQTLIIGQRIFERYVEDRHLIPPENLYEIAYSDLVGNEMAVLEQVYGKLRIPGWQSNRATLQAYVDGLAGYERNKLKKISRKEKRLVYDHWRVAFDAFGYDQKYPPVEPVHATERFQPPARDEAEEAPAAQPEPAAESLSVESAADAVETIDPEVMAAEPQASSAEPGLGLGADGPVVDAEEVSSSTPDPST